MWFRGTGDEWEILFVDALHKIRGQSVGKRAQTDLKDSKNPQGRTELQDLRNSRVVRGVKSAGVKRITAAHQLR